MRLDEFLRRFIEGYLFADVESIQRDVHPPTADGHCGYPMLMSCLAGIEVLGVLAGATPYSTLVAKQNKTALKAADPYLQFCRYWEDYLYTATPQREAGMAIYQLLRHGVAHNFASKQPIQVTRREAGHHLRTDPGSGVTYIDADSLFGDLCQSYRNSIHAGC